MTRPLPFTQASLQRAIKAARKADLHVTGIPTAAKASSMRHGLDLATEGVAMLIRTQWIEGIGLTIGNKWQRSGKNWQQRATFGGRKARRKAPSFPRMYEKQSKVRECHAAV